MVSLTPGQNLISTLDLFEAKLNLYKHCETALIFQRFPSPQLFHPQLSENSAQHFCYSVMSLLSCSKAFEIPLLNKDPYDLKHERKKTNLSASNLFFSLAHFYQRVKPFLDVLMALSYQFLYTY